MEIDEKSYEAGNRAAWRKTLETACRELGYADSQAAKASWHKEREESIIALRELCSSLGDNDWPDDLFITDIINKHLCYKRIFVLPSAEDHKDTTREKQRRGHGKKNKEKSEGLQRI